MRYLRITYKLIPLVTASAAAVQRTSAREALKRVARAKHPDDEKHSLDPTDTHLRELHFARVSPPKPTQLGLCETEPL